MKLFTSYYYQIRNFRPYMIPIASSMTLPKWYYDKDYHQYIDKRGIINGIRCRELAMPKDYYYDHLEVRCGGRSCDADPTKCEFLKQYKEYLDTCLDWKDFYKRAEILSEILKSALKIKSEPFLVICFFESPQNLCSERGAVQDWAKKNGYNLEELKYPIEENYI